jgi:hypothetical protein
MFKEKAKGYTIKCRLGGAGEADKKRKCQHAIGLDGCNSKVICMMAYGVKGKTVVFDNLSYHLSNPPIKRN